MVRVMVRRSRDVSYLVNDGARELEDLRESPAWWLRGSGDVENQRDVDRVLTSTSRSSVVGYDLVVAAPRPVSILVALDPEHGRAVVDAHRQAVVDAVSYLDRRAVVVHERAGGDDVQRAAHWSGVVGFTHGVNRHGEPHLHDHVLVGARPEGASQVLDGRALFAHAFAADALYRSSLRHGLAQRTPWAAWRTFSGVELVDGLDEGYRALWGGHHHDRDEKRYWERAEVVERWRHDLERFEAAGVIAPPPRRGYLDEHRFGAAFEGLTDVTRRHVVAAWADAAVHGQSARSVEESVDRLYPELIGPGGVRERSVGRGDARRTSLVRAGGPRPLERSAFDRWCREVQTRELVPRERVRESGERWRFERWRLDAAIGGSTQARSRPRSRASRSR
jgi:hypothetical protein